MSDRRRKQKGRKSRGSFLAMPHEILNDDNFTSLSPRAVKLLIDVASQYRGDNNGDLCCAWSVMSKRGWTSNDQLYKARDELLSRGWIVITRQGQRPRLASLYALTWLPIDECNGKLDCAPTKQALGYWKLGSNPEHVTKKCDLRHTDYIGPQGGSMKQVETAHRAATRLSRGVKHAIS